MNYQEWTASHLLRVLMSDLSKKLSKIAALSLERGQPSLFKRLSSLSILVARSDRTDTDKMLSDSLSQERGDEPPIEVVDADGDGELEVDDDDDDDDDDEDAEDSDKEAYFPMSALPQKERRKGPHPKDVKPARPDWWNPR